MRRAGCAGVNSVLVVVLILAAGTSACAVRDARPPGPRIGALLSTTPVIDGHNDLLIHYLDKSGKSFADANSYAIGGTTAGQSDLPRLRSGQIGAAIFTVAILDQRDREAGIKESTGLIRAIAARHHNELEVVTGSAALLGAFKAGRIAALMSLEGGDQIGDSVEMVETLHRHGVRAMTLTWEKSNQIGDSSSDFPKHDGLSAFGTAVVREMNRLGMVIDLSHAAETTAGDVLALSRVPVMFSHSSAKALCPAPRNVSDELVRRVAANGGIVMVSFVPYFTSAEHWAWYERGEKYWANLERIHGAGSAAASRAMKVWDSENPAPVVTLQQVADHIDHVRRIAGTDHVGLGSDFNGMGSFTIRGLEDASELPALFVELARRGWSDAELRKLAGENFLRVLRAVERGAR